MFRDSANQININKVLITERDLLTSTFISITKGGNVNLQGWSAIIFDRATHQENSFLLTHIMYILF